MREIVKKIIDQYSSGERDFHDVGLDGSCLSGYDFSGANFPNSSFSNSYLCRTSFVGANLSGVDFKCANLSEANFCGADLSGANLSFTRLDLTKFNDANLNGTILDPKNKITPLSDDELEDFEIDGDYVIGYRTQYSIIIGSTRYHTGRMYEAPYFSVDHMTSCHPGIYMASKKYIMRMYSRHSIVKCKCLRSELIKAGDKFRAKRIWIIERIGYID